jgi:hypothetical protein
MAINNFYNLNYKNYQPTRLKIFYKINYYIKLNYFIKNIYGMKNDK